VAAAAAVSRNLVAAHKPRALVVVSKVAGLVVAKAAVLAVAKAVEQLAVRQTGKVARVSPSNP
jgi:hypothetical protein